MHLYCIYYFCTIYTIGDSSRNTSTASTTPSVARISSCTIDSTQASSDKMSSLGLFQQMPKGKLALMLGLFTIMLGLIHIPYSKYWVYCSLYGFFVGFITI